jgi:hypothetical protein
MLPPWGFTAREALAHLSEPSTALNEQCGERASPGSLPTRRYGHCRVHALCCAPAPDPAIFSIDPVVWTCGKKARREGNVIHDPVGQGRVLRPSANYVLRSAEKSCEPSCAFQREFVLTAGCQKSVRGQSWRHLATAVSMAAFEVLTLLGTLFRSRVASAGCSGLSLQRASQRKRSPRSAWR